MPGTLSQSGSGLALIACLLLLCGCAYRPYRELAREVAPTSPHAALECLARSLSEHPADRETRSLLQRTILAISSDHEDRMRSLRAADQYRQAVAECDRLIAAKYLVDTLPGGFHLYSPQTERRELAQLAAEKHYRLGKRRLREGSQKGGESLALRDAVVAFDRTLGFVPGYRDARKLRREALSRSRVTLRMRYAAGQYERLGNLLAEALSNYVRERRPRFLRFSTGGGDHDGVCELTLYCDYRDSGWVCQKDTGEKEIEKETDDGSTYTVTKRASWRPYTRNQTTRKIDTDQLIKKIRIALLRSGKAVVTSASTPEGAADRMIDEARELREDVEFDQSTVPGRGELLAPELSLSGKILQRLLEAPRREEQVEYYFMLTLTDLSSGLAIWEGEAEVVKAGSER